MSCIIHPIRICALTKLRLIKSATRISSKRKNLLLTVLLSQLLYCNISQAQASEQELGIALLMADILRAARSEIASQQPNINNELVEDKGLTGEVIVARILDRLKEADKPDPKDLPVNSREAILVNAQLESIEEIIEENQPLINRKGIAFKGFVPATFAQLSNERFGEKVGNLAEIKVTAPINLVRNRKARPDQWENDTIESKFLSSQWQTGQLFAETAAAKNGEAFRVIVPEYYGAACLACHGSPAGETDVTGYEKEGGQLNELGGAISITLYQ